MSELLLGVNIDHIATLRNMRGTAWPDPIQAAFIAEQAGADCITIHLRTDRRHITNRDVRLLRQTIQTKMNLEIAISDETVAIACDLAPHCCCLVPEQRQEMTTECGLNIINQLDDIHRTLIILNNAGIQVSLFIDANERQILAAKDIGALYIEIHTGAYANAIDEVSRARELALISQSVEFAAKCGLKVNAGHGLNYHNVKPIAALKQIQELNIGHAIISRAVIDGLSNAVKDMKRLIHEART